MSLRQKLDDGFSLLLFILTIVLIGMLALLVIETEAKWSGYYDSTAVHGAK